MKTNFTSTLESLTELEIACVRSACESSLGNGHDFGFTDDIVVEGKSKKVVGGAISSLLKKNVISRDDDYGQFVFGTDWDAPIKHDYAELVYVFLKALDTPEPSRDDEKKARRRLRRAARKAAKKI